MMSVFHCPESLLRFLRCYSSDTSFFSFFPEFFIYLYSYLFADFFTLSFSSFIYFIYFSICSLISVGQKDLVSAGRKVYSTDAIGSPKRSGGQGDILAGCLGVTACWTGKYVKLNPTDPFNIENDGNGILCVGDNAENPFIWGALWASALTKRSSEKAFSVHDRSMSSVDVINCLGKQMKLMEDSKE